ncbi:MAG: hypoxanthine phosphoribosyltransferase [Alphaproteobacteria bacterium]
MTAAAAVEGATAPVEQMFSARKIAGRVRQLADGLAAELPERVVVLSLLKGSFIFAADLVRALHDRGVKCRVEFLTVASYGNATESSGRLRIEGELPDDLGDKAVLLIDDILDTGRTLKWARDAVLEAGASRVLTCVLLDKPERREVDVAADYVGFTIPDRFVVGYGIDYAQQYRDLPYIGALSE